MTTLIALASTCSSKRPNNSFKPNSLRYTKAMAEKACHGFASTTQVGLTQVLAPTGNFMHGRMITKLLLIISACMATSGCLTQKLFDDTRLYTEVVDAAFISPDSKKVAVLGSEYDYVFADVEDLSAIIKSEVHDDLHADMSSFTVGADNSVYGGIVLSMPRGNSDAEDLAESLGFMKDGNAHLRKTIQISGVRYRKNSELKLLESYKLNNTYKIRVREPANRSSSRLLLTPITIAADGVVLLFAIPVVTFLLHREANPGGS